MSEQQQQEAVIQWFDHAHPKHKNLLVGSPNGALVGGRNKFALVAKLKKAGMRNGFPDLFLYLPKGGFNGLAIEMKDIKKTQCSVSKSQLQFLNDLSDQGYLATWCAGADDAISMIKDYMGSNDQEDYKPRFLRASVQEA